MAEMAQSDHFPKKTAGRVILSPVYLMPIRNDQIDEEYCGGLNESSLPRADVFESFSPGWWNRLGRLRQYGLVGEGT